MIVGVVSDNEIVVSVVTDNEIVVSFVTVFNCINPPIRKEMNPKEAYFRPYNEVFEAWILKLLKKSFFSRKQNYLK